MDFVAPQVMLAVVVGIGCCAAWILAFGRLARGQPILARHPRRGASWGLIDLALAAVLLVTFQLVSAYLLQHGFGIAITRTWDQLPLRDLALVTLAESVANLAAMSTALALIGARTRAGWRDLGITFERVPQDLWLELVAFVMLAPPVYGIQRLLVIWYPYQHPLISTLQKHHEPMVQAAIFFSAVVAAPIVEEFFYRVLWLGWLQGVLPRLGQFSQLVLGNPAVSDQSLDQGLSLADDGVALAVRSPSSAEAFAIVASSALFAAMHVSHGPAPVPLFVLALGLGYVYARTGRILPCIVVHVLLNGCSLVTLLLELRGT